MNESRVPKALRKGDTIALLAISGGRAGDADMLYRYEIGRKRLEELWNVHAVAAPNALLGSEYLYHMRQKRQLHARNMLFQRLTQLTYIQSLEITI